MQGEEQRRLREENKRVRVDTPVLERELFRLFEMQPAWTFQQLQLETKQPTMHLKNVLEQVRKHFCGARAHQHQEGIRSGGP